MRRNVAVLTSLSLAVAMAVGLSQCFVTDDEALGLEVAEQGSRSSSGSSDTAAVKLSSSRAMRSDGALTSGAAKEAVTASLEPQSGERFDQNISKDSLSHSEEPSATGIVDAETSSDHADIIGRPFPVSPSVARTCEAGPGPASREFCGEVFSVLAEMARQPRDAVWADKTESLLAERILNEQPNMFSIRSVECRTTLCAIEVESQFGPYLGVGGAFEDTHGLLGLLHLHAYERNERGARVTVTLRPYERRTFSSSIAK